MDGEAKGERAHVPHPRSITAKEVDFSLSSDSDASYRVFPSASYHLLSQTQKLKNERSRQRSGGESKFRMSSFYRPG